MLNVDMEIEKSFYQALDKIENDRFSRLTYTDMANVGLVSMSTIRKHVPDLEKYAKQLIVCAFQELNGIGALPVDDRLGKRMGAHRINLPRILEYIAVEDNALKYKILLQQLDGFYRQRVINGTLQRRLTGAYYSQLLVYGTWLRATGKVSAEQIWPEEKGLDIAMLITNWLVRYVVKNEGTLPELISDIEKRTALVSDYPWIFGVA